jgi:hypothetical protein
MKKLISALVATAFFASCSSTTMIRSTDPQAKIFVDGEYKGVGTATHTDTKIVGSTTSIRIEKPGCEPQFYNFSRSEEFDVGACIGGALVLVPFLWIEKYKPEHNYEYICTVRK